MTAEGCREWRERLGACVLGQLPVQESAATRAHLEGCPACRAEAESLAPLARLLPLADPEQLGSAPAPPAGLGERIAAQVAGKRRRSRRRRRIAIGLSGAAAAAAAAALGLAVLAGSGPDADAGSQTVRFKSMPPGVSIAATLQPRPFGTEIRIDVSGVRAGTLCRVFLRRVDGKRMPAGSFRYRYSGPEQAVLTTALDLSAANAIGVRAGGRTFMAPLEADMSARAPTVGRYG